MTMPESQLSSVLRASYTAEELPVLSELLDAFVAAHGPALSAVQQEHSPGADSYVEARDWVYAEPEFRIIAERSVNRPFMLWAALDRSDFEQVVIPMIDAIRSAVSSAVAGRRA